MGSMNLTFSYAGIRKQIYFMFFQLVAVLFLITYQIKNIGSQSYTLELEISKIVVVSLFVVESILNLFLLGKSYFGSKWNIVDFIFFLTLPVPLVLPWITSLDKTLNDYFEASSLLLLAVRYNFWIIKAFIDPEHYRKPYCDFKLSDSTAYVTYDNIHDFGNSLDYERLDDDILIDI